MFLLFGEAISRPALGEKIVALMPQRIDHFGRLDFAFKVLRTT
jgi:hypothetical protein